MTIASLKSKLHKLIDKNENKEFLNELVQMVKEVNSKKDWWNELSPELQRQLDEASKDIKKNGGIPHEVVMKRMRKWLAKKSS